MYYLDYDQNAPAVDFEESCNEAMADAQIEYDQQTDESNLPF